MAISAISSRYAGFTFDGESSKTYGVYITDGGFYSAPIRDTEVVEIPGRNGAYILDRGRFKNIQVTYKAAMGADSKADFISGISAVRNWLCSKKGYVRLTDDFNPDEYRLATFSNGLEVSNINPKTGEFDITFECMPQRFLTSGETAQTITSSGDTLTNPTLFNARPMLEADGYGTIAINGEEIEIISGPIGRVPVKLSYNVSQSGDGPSTTFNVLGAMNSNVLNTGDVVTVLGGKLELTLSQNSSFLSITNLTFSQTGSIFKSAGANGSNIEVAFNNFTFAFGTPRTGTATVVVYYRQGLTSSTATFTLTATVASDGSFTVTVAQDFTGDGNNHTLSFSIVWAISTKSALGSPIYIDLDIGEAWKIEGGQMVSVNNAVSMPAELPELEPGANEITFDNTVTELKIVPRWWKV